MTGAFLSVPRYDWCAPLSLPFNDRNISRDWCVPLSHSSSRVLVDFHSRTQKKKKSHGIDVLSQDTTHLIKDHVTNGEVRAKTQQTIGLYEDLTIANRSKLKGCGHVSRSWGLAKPILQGTVKGGEDREDRRRDWKTTPGNGQAWSSPNCKGQRR